MNSVTNRRLAEGYIEELAALNAGLASVVEQVVSSVAGDLSEEEFSAWLNASRQLSRDLSDAPAVSINYLRSSKEILGLSGPATLTRCADIALELAHRSPEIATSFLQAAPSFLSHGLSSNLKDWADMGSRMCTDSWKSVSLAKTFFALSHSILESTSLASFRVLAQVVTELSRRSIELAISCLKQAAENFSSLEDDVHLPYLNLAGVIVRSNWNAAWLYFEQAPGKLNRFQRSETSAFLSLIAPIAAEGSPYSRFEEISLAVSQFDENEHGELAKMAQRLVDISPVAAAEFLISAPFIRERLSPSFMWRWLEMGLEMKGDDAGLEQVPSEELEAYFRLQSVTADKTLALLSGRVEFEKSANLFRFYGQALTGDKVLVQPASHLVNRGLGWTSGARATTEGTVIFVPPHIDLFGDIESNLQIYKVCIAHQSGRLTFGSHDFQYDVNGRYLESTINQRREVNSIPAIVPIQGFFNRFQDRLLIEGIFSLVEDYRVDCCIQAEYPGLRKWSLKAKNHEISQRPGLLDLGLRQVFIENLLRASLGHMGSIRWPAAWKPIFESALGTLRIAARPEATVQDTAEIASLLYDFALDIPNIPARKISAEWVAIEDIHEGLPRPDVKTVLGTIDMTGIQELDYENPVPPLFFGDLKPELVQTLNELRNDSALERPTEEQIRSMLENSVEVENADLDTVAEQIETDFPVLMADANEDEDGTGHHGSADTTEVISWSTYDEWDFRANDYLSDWCQLGERNVAKGELEYYEETLNRYSGLVMEVRRQFELMRPESQRALKDLDDGHEIDLDKAIQFFVDKKAQVGPRARFYTRRDKIERSVAVAFLLDMSGSTDESIDETGTPAQTIPMPGTASALKHGSGKKIIDLEKESMILAIEALDAIGDTFGIYGFSGHGRNDVSFHVVKELDQVLDDTVKKRIDSITPLRSTRMGAAVRHANAKLLACPAKVRILMLISDGRPQDHGYGQDSSDQEYAIHDTKQALVESKQEGIVPFLITVDKQGHDYLQDICGDIGYEVIADIESLPRRLPTIYKYLATRA
tara:strand:- start:35221 stop:38361 length:3141 start_codon:yes stop_codon:yes gene_type:complete